MLTNIYLPRTNRAESLGILSFYYAFPVIHVLWSEKVILVLRLESGQHTGKIIDVNNELREEKSGGKGKGTYPTTYQTF